MDETFKHPVTGEILPDKRLMSAKIETILAKVSMSQDMTEATIKNIERSQDTNNKMLEGLIRSEYKSLKDELNNHNENNLRDFHNAITTQRQINDTFRTDLRTVSDCVKEHDKKIASINTKPIKTKAAIMDKIALALIGGGIALLVTKSIQLIQIILTVKPPA
jgi:hypothetical protein